MRESLPDSEVVVHLEPRREGLSLRDRALGAALAEPLVRDVHNISIYRRGDRVSVSLHLKLDPDVPLAEAHEVAERIEASLREEPRVEDVHTHLEPLERPLTAQSTTRPTTPIASALPTRGASTGTPRGICAYSTPHGLVVFVSVVAGPDDAGRRARTGESARRRHSRSAATHG